MLREAVPDVPQSSLMVFPEMNSSTRGTVSLKACAAALRFSRNSSCVGFGPATQSST